MKSLDHIAAALQGYDPDALPAHVVNAFLAQWVPAPQRTETIALIQALTQVQEATLTFVPKILAIFAALLLLAPVASAQLMSFTEQVYQHIETGF